MRGGGWARSWERLTSAHDHTRALCMLTGRMASANPGEIGPGDPGAPGPAGGALPRWLLPAAAAACLLYFAAEAWMLGFDLGFPLDDSWIHLQFARNLAAGRGLSYNPGELVTGSTAPLWTALLALLAYLPGNPVAWAQLAGALLYLAGIDATWRLAR